MMAYRIKISLSKRQLTVLKNGAVVKTYPVGIGKKETPTPVGTFTIINRAVEPGGPFGVRWLGLSLPHYGIHGTNRPDTIGKAVSNGCIRMYNNDVLELANLVPIGTVVEIRQ